VCFVIVRYKKKSVEILILILSRSIFNTRRKVLLKFASPCSSQRGPAVLGALTDNKLSGSIPYGVDLFVFLFFCILVLWGALYYLANIKTLFS
jgi:hypothetical protein